MGKWLLNNYDWLIPLLFAVLSTAIGIFEAIQSKSKKKALNVLKSSICNFIKEAEEFKNYTGAEKKAYVMTRALKISYNLMSSAEIDNYIEEQVTLTNLVNIAKKGK